MTLPFRRRHHDDETAHDRARSLISTEMVEALPEGEAAWLVHHLDGCAECRRDRDAYLEDQTLLRSLRDTNPEPPRDLWARTSAALDREAARRARSGADRATGTGRFRWGSLPLGAAAGALVLLLAFSTVLLQRPVPPSATAGATQFAVASENPGPTPISIESAKPISFVRAAADGSLEIVTSSVDAVCPASEPTCKPPIDEDATAHVRLGSKASRVTISPQADQLVIEPANEAGSLGRILVMPVPRATTTPTQAPTTVPATPTVPPRTSAAPPSDIPTLGPSLEPTPEPTPEGQVEIATGVTIVGDVAYSADGRWLAFSARPVDGSAGPDLYLWAVGSPSATQVTSDHQTYFSAWLGDQVLASRVEIEAAPGASGEPGTSGEPPASGALGGEPSTTPDQSGTPDGSGAPTGSGEPAGEPVVGRPSSFVLDPATQVRVDFPLGNVWLPVVDPMATKTVYWAGTLLSADGINWSLGQGELVLDGWATGVEAPFATGEAPPATEAATSSLGASPEASSTPLGPIGVKWTVVPGPIGAFRARFDPHGDRLAVWVAEDASAGVGRLHLLVIDPTTGNVDAEHSPLKGEPALPAFSIDEGRLAWVSPDGQDGEQSSVKILGWQDSAFGEIQTRSGTDILIVR